MQRVVSQIINDGKVRTIDLANNLHSMFVIRHGAARLVSQLINDGKLQLDNTYIYIDSKLICRGVSVADHFYDKTLLFTNLSALLSHPLAVPRRPPAPRLVRTGWC